jgi:hypothetical protein
MAIEMTAPAAGGRPHRVRLSRKLGYRMPPNTLKVDRSTRWGNPFYIFTVARNVTEFRAWINGRGSMIEGTPPSHAAIRHSLGGKNLACWCPLPAPGEPDMCHAAVLLEIANSSPFDRTTILRRRGGGDHGRKF